jgi:hypothetical protein
LAESLDKDLTCACLLTSVHCRKQRQTSWSPKVIKARATVNLLKHLLGMYRTHVYMTRSIAKLCSKAGRRQPLPNTAEACSTTLCIAQAALKCLLKEAASHRCDHLENLSAICTLHEDKERSQILKHLIKAEDIKAMYAKLRAIGNNCSKQGISKLKVPTNLHDDPKTCRQWRTVDLPDKILSLLCKRNQAHFGQAEGTPFTMGTLKEDFAFEGATQTSNLVRTQTALDATS